ncbi:hypothetical protein GCM10011534_00460 [Pseudooceanicola nanhaiensis]|uniref:Uncharacterized protein n=1 Tax=Pseudooceanicola nanhaiensis TaxID=375761 RepID=A0A917SI51_9RHOB|nr:hypothetical protein GCM10011534_00460 [Pseudooceanicola nanhaiensis]
MLAEPKRLGLWTSAFAIIAMCPGPLISGQKWMGDIQMVSHTPKRFIRLKRADIRHKFKSFQLSQGYRAAESAFLMAGGWARHFNWSQAV